jgi:hypothetical protein
MPTKSRHITRGDFPNEEKLTRMEEEGQAALEMAQEEDAPTQACPEDAQEVGSTPGGMG